MTWVFGFGVLETKEQHIRELDSGIAINGCPTAYDFFHVPFAENGIKPNYFHCYSHDYLADLCYIC